MCIRDSLSRGCTIWRSLFFDSTFLQLHIEAIKSTLNIVPSISIIEQWKDDYNNMQLHMIYGESTSFKELVKELVKLNLRINQIK